jgi:beta-RFAP synthase
MVRFWTPSRLHFGVLSLADPGTLWRGREGTPALPARRFGGVGLMVERPGLRVSVEPARVWSAEGPLAERALAFARRFAEHLRPGEAVGGVAPQRIVVETDAVEHVGLGTGTQLGLAMAAALARAWDVSLEVTELARRVGRGLRSALGAHGFAHGGFLVEAGQRSAGELGPLVARAEFPDSWRVVLAFPRGLKGLHGAGEMQAFDCMRGRTTPLQTDALCRLALLGMLPALFERDLTAFGEALFDFNARVGEMFAAAQGGVYAGAAVAEVVAFVRGRGVRGVGQSSWGPAVFAVVEEGEAPELADAVRVRFGFPPGTVLVARGCNRGGREEANAPRPAPR